MIRICQLIAVTLLFYVFNGSAYAKALSSFNGPMHYSNSSQMTTMHDGVYERYNYPYFGAYLTVATSVNHNPDDGDTWTLDLFDTYYNQVVGGVSVRYDRASDCILHQETALLCGLYIEADDPKVFYGYINIYFFGECISVNEYELWADIPGHFEYWPFTPVRFKPYVDTLSIAEAIRPAMQRSQGESTTVSVVVKDDLNCGRVLNDVDVTFEHFFVPQSGGHANITQEEPITGYYSVISGSGGTVVDAEQRSIIFENPDPKKDSVVQSYMVAPKIEGTTNVFGRFKALYTAGIFGGQERVVVTSSIPHLSEKDPEAENTAEKTIDIRVPGLAEIPRVGDAHRFDMGPSCGSFNPDARWLTEKNRERALELARLWYDFHGEKLSYNDASLVNGGVIEKLTIDKGCHQTHRRGAHIDINNLLNALFAEDCGESGEHLCRYYDLVTFGRWVGLKPGYSGGIHFLGGE